MPSNRAPAPQNFGVGHLASYADGLRVNSGFAFCRSKETEQSEGSGRRRGYRYPVAVLAADLGKSEIGELQITMIDVSDLVETKQLRPI
jgi:hypothetical protein